MSDSTENTILATTITPAQLLTAAREGKITATIIDSETLTPLAGGDGPEQYPSCTIALQIDGQTLRELSAWKLVYYSTEGDTLNSGRGTYDFRDVSSDGATRGDATVTVDGEDAEDIRPEDRDAIMAALTAAGLDSDIPDATYAIPEGDNDAEASERYLAAIAAALPPHITVDWTGNSDTNAEGETTSDCRFTRRMATVEIATGEGCSSVESIDITGLTDDEAEEVREAIESAIDDAYSDWTPEHPEESEIYDALVGQKYADTDVSATIGEETIKVELYAGTHCGKEQYAVAGDDDQTVYDDADEAATAAREKLIELLQAAIDDEAALDKQESEAAEALRAANKDAE